jgi:cystathionine beta-synthase
MKPAKSILELIGNTPLVEIPQSLTDCRATVLCKLEWTNPGGSIKDRLAKYVINTEEQRGRIRPGDTICDNTSGNTGVGVAMVAAAKGYRSVFAVYDTTSLEKIDLIKSYGAEVIITPAEVAWDDPRGGYMIAKRLSQEHGYYWLNQYDNPLNPEAHYADTGPEIWNQTDGKVTCFVAGIGTGGTISGIGKFLKEKNPSARVVGVEPQGSLFQAIHAGRPLGQPHPHKVEGIGTDMVVKAFVPKYTDQVFQVTDNDAFLAARLLTKTMGLSVGGSTGSIFCALRQIRDTLTVDDVVVMLSPDAGIRYITKFFSDDWMRRHNFKLEEDVIVHV